MDLLKKFVSAVSAAALAVSALTAAYAPLAYADEYDAVQSSLITEAEEPSDTSADEEYSGYSGLELSELNATSKSKADFTIMVYMVGSDLESNDGLATEDIKEMCKGLKGSKVNLIIQTGGAKEWHYSGTTISSKKCQRFQATSKGLKLVDDSLGQQDMSNKNTLCNFIKYCKKNYAASRYGLILWNHGGGTIGGFGVDENYNGSSMSLIDYEAALDKAGVHFDFVGFDACLMASIETALLTADHADYLICAEDLSSGIGWYYTDWIRTLCNNTKIATSALGKSIADSTVKKCVSLYKYSTDEISVINLKTVVDTVLPALNTFSQNSLTFLSNKKYSTVAKKRHDLTIYTSSTELVDISRYASAFSDESLLAKSAANLKAAVKKAVIYRKAAGISAYMGGLSFAFPFADLENLDLVCEIYEESGYDTVYTDFLVRFANIMAGGQQYKAGTNEKYNYSACDWYDPSQFYHNNYYSKFYLGSGDEILPVSLSNGNYVLKITDDMDEVISSYELYMCSVEQKGSSTLRYEYGTDNLAQFDNQGNLIVGFDKKWVSLNGKPITCYYDHTYREGNYEEYISRVRGRYNGQEAWIYLGWNNQYLTYPNNGIIFAWSPIEDGGRITRTYYCERGDRFKVYYSVLKDSKWYWTTDNTVYTIGKVKLSYSDVSKFKSMSIRYEITDIFNNVYYTEWVNYWAN